MDVDNKNVIIVGSSNRNGETTKLANTIAKKWDCDVVHLMDYQFSYYDYEHHNKNDDFISLIKKIIESYDTLIFATPVYWYSMSGILKVFFDRLTDLLTIEKELGRKLRGKRMAAVSSSNGNNLGEQFWLPFEESAKYLGMRYLGNIHTIAGELKGHVLSEFIRQIDESSKKV